MNLRVIVIATLLLGLISSLVQWSGEQFPQDDQAVSLTVFEMENRDDALLLVLSNPTTKKISYWNSFVGEDGRAVTIPPFTSIQFRNSTGEIGRTRGFLEGPFERPPPMTELAPSERFEAELSVSELLMWTNLHSSWNLNDVAEIKVGVQFDLDENHDTQIRAESEWIPVTQQMKEAANEKLEALKARSLPPYLRDIPVIES